MLSVREVGDKLKKAARLRTRPLCVYGADLPPRGTVPLNVISTCVAEAAFICSSDRSVPGFYVSKVGRTGCCPGGQAYLGFSGVPEYVRYFVSTGSGGHRGGAAEYLRASPELVDESWRRHGRVLNEDKHLIVCPCSDVTDDSTPVRSVLLFGKAQQIRNLCSLFHFRSSDTVSGILMPWGASCASFITYPAGMFERGPRDSAIIGPSDPTGNKWFPSDHMSLGLPLEVARRMAEDIDASFLAKRAKVAFPEKK